MEVACANASSLIVRGRPFPRAILIVYFNLFGHERPLCDHSRVVMQKMKSLSCWRGIVVSRQSVTFGAQSVCQWLGIRPLMAGGTKPPVPNPHRSPKNPRPLDQNDHTGQLGHKNAQTYKHMARVRFTSGACVRFRISCATIRCAHGDRGAGISTSPMTTSMTR